MFAVKLIPACSGSFFPDFNFKYWLSKVISAGNLYPFPSAGIGARASEPILVTLPLITPKSVAGNESILISPINYL